MRTYEEMKAIALSNPVVRAEFDRIEREEMPMLDAILKARKEAKLTQEQVAKRMGVSTPVVSRLESALISGKHSPSIATLKRYAEAMGKRLDIRFAWSDKTPICLNIYHIFYSILGNKYAGYSQI